MKEADPNLHANRVEQACVEKNGAVRVHRNAPRRNIVLATLGVLSAFMLLLCPLAYSQTSLSAQTVNNTAGCAAAGSPSYCLAKWAGLSDSTSGTYDALASNVSMVDIHSLIPGGNATKVLAHFQPWFCMNTASTSTGVGTSCGSHLQVGYNSNNSSTVNGQMNDMRRRGFNGVVVDWYGPTLNNYDQVSQKIKSNLVGRCSGPQACPLYMALMEDQGAFIWTKCRTNGGGISITQQTNCIANALESDLDYMNSNYFGSNAYLKVNGMMQISAAGRPVVFFFICESCFTNPTPSWSTIWNSVASHVASYSGGAPLFIFENAGGFTNTQTDGAFGWMNWWGTSDSYGFTYLDNFYDTSVNYGALLNIGAAWKGFDNSNAPWVGSSPRIIQQQCGNTFLQSVRQLTHNSDWGSSNPLPFLGVVTWNDYEEGTEIESGIDNCLSLSASVSGSTLSWTLKFSSSAGSESTVHHYLVFDSTSTTTLVQLATVYPGTHYLNLGKYSLAAGKHVLYIKAVGQSSIQDHMSNSVVYNVP
jgi:hypothetical protein